MKTQTELPSRLNEWPAVAIVVPCHKWDDWLLDCVQHCHKLDYPHFTLWLLPNEMPDEHWKKRLETVGQVHPVIIEPTGPSNPACKRNVALHKAQESILAFIDADAYPRNDWLKQAVPLLRDKVGIVAGPNLTPPRDALRRRISGHVMASPLGFGPAHIRHRPVSRRLVNEMPTCNMVIRRPPNLFFDERLDTAEDMVFCEDMRAQGLTILYDPEVVVFHHRRAVYLPFFKQFYNYGLYKGWIARKGKGSTYLWQAMPALLMIYLLIVNFIWLCPWPARIISLSYLPLFLYFLAIIFESLKVSSGALEALMTITGFLVAHLGYGMGYLSGFFRRRANKIHAAPPHANIPAT